MCRAHGGAAPQVIAKARKRLSLAADRMAMELLWIATGADSEAVKLAAIRDTLDRVGLSAKRELELSAAQSEPQPYEEMLMGIAGIAQITRGESYARRGLPPPPAAPELPPAEPPRALPGVVDAELVEPADDRPADVLHSPTDDVKPAEGRRVPDD